MTKQGPGIDPQAIRAVMDEIQRRQSAADTGAEWAQPDAILRYITGVLTTGAERGDDACSRVLLRLRTIRAGGAPPHAILRGAISDLHTLLSQQQERQALALIRPRAEW